jgi:hypothetical protein
MFSADQVRDRAADGLAIPDRRGLISILRITLMLRGGHGLPHLAIGFYRSVLNCVDDFLSTPDDLGVLGRSQRDDDVPAEEAE